MLSQLSLREAVEQIKLLIDEEKLQEAYRACLEILRYDPENIHVIHLKIKLKEVWEKSIDKPWKPIWQN